MKVLFEAKNIGGHSGIDRYSRELFCALLDRDDVSVALISSIKSRSTYPSLKSIGGVPISKSIFNEFALGGTSVLRAVVRGINRLSRIRVGGVSALVHQTNPFYYVDHSGPFVVTIHDLIPLQEISKLSDTFRANYERSISQLARRVDAICTPTEFVRRELIEAFPECQGKTFVTHLGVSSDFGAGIEASKTLEKLELKGIRRFFLFVGRADDRKNVDGVISAYSLLPQAVQREHDLLLVLSQGSYRDQMVEKARTMPTSGSIKIIDSVDDGELIGLYSSCTAFVFPTLAEGFGLPVVEGMKSGRPVITSNLSCIPEIVGDGAILINPFSPDEIASAMEKVATDHSFADEVSRRGIERAKHFSWENCARETVKVYRSAIEHRS